MHQIANYIGVKDHYSLYKKAAEGLLDKQYFVVKVYHELFSRKNKQSGKTSLDLSLASLLWQEEERPD